MGPPCETLLWVAVRTMNSSQASLKSVLLPLKSHPLDFKWGEGHLPLGGQVATQDHEASQRQRSGLALRFAGPDAALRLGGRAAPEAVVWPLPRSPFPAGQVGVLGTEEV